MQALPSPPREPSSAYATVTDLFSLGGPSATVELVSGRADTLVRLWAMPGGGMKLGVLESIYDG